MRVLLIDDQRKPVYIKVTHGIDVTHTATSYAEGIQMLSQNEPFDLLCLDHDLSSYDETGRELTGYDIMVFLEQNPCHMPKDIFFVTANPVGRINMQRVFDSIKNRMSQNGTSI